jgi:hypothetical protein
MLVGVDCRLTFSLTAPPFFVDVELDISAVGFHCTLKFLLCVPINRADNIAYNRFAESACG